jgi:REP element-mobilizing transposase RayT
MFTVGYAYRRRLPHFQKEGRTYFVTFNAFNRWTLPSLARDIVLNHIKFDHQRRIWISIALVMPDHVHLIGTPIDSALHRILKGLKGSSARSVNKALDRRGPVWQDESFDHELRRDESLVQKGEYIAMNPVRRGLVEKPEEYRWLWIPE